MMHRITTLQYSGFLNTLRAEQAEARYPGNRVAVRSGESADCFQPPGENINASGLSWADGAAFAAWAGLRPLTELEWEKAVRGPREPVPDEVGPAYWGISYISWFWEALHDGVADARTVTVGHAAGRKFAGTHGLGTPALPADWPQEDAVGAGIRGDARTTSAAVRLSDRRYAAAVDPERGRVFWRAARTAPKEAAQ
jgi:hypothetical protein